MSNCKLGEVKKELGRRWRAESEHGVGADAGVGLKSGSKTEAETEAKLGTEAQRKYGAEVKILGLLFVKEIVGQRLTPCPMSRKGSAPSPPAPL